MGDGRCLPSANHVSSSATQKSGSICAAITSVSVNKSPFDIEKFIPWAVRYWATGISSSGKLFCSAVGCGVSGVVSSFFLSSSKLTSEKIGANDDMLLSMSKSVGNGNSLVVGSSGIGCDASCWLPIDVTMFLMSKFDFGAGPVCRRARSNANCNSVGIDFFGASSISVDGLIVAESFDSSSGFFLSSFGTGCINLGIFTVINGFFVRTIIMVVAIYIGSAAKINMPKTKPGNPRKCACINICHCVDEKILKLNIHFKMPHMIKM